MIVSTDHLQDYNNTDINVLINKNYELISKISRVQGKHMVIEISGGQFKMNEYSCTDLLNRVRAGYDAKNVNCSGAITYRDCKMMLTDIEYVYSIDTRFECILVRLFPISCLILRNSILVVVNENMKMDGFIKDLCRITDLYGKMTMDDRPSPRYDTSVHSKRYASSLSALDDSTITYNLRLPFEICVLECCFITSISHLESDLISFENKYKILEDKVYNNKKFKDISIILHELKHPVSNLLEISTGFEELINEILDSEEDIKILEFSNHVIHYAGEQMKSNLSYRPVNHDLQFLLEFIDQEVEQLSKRTKTLDNSLVHLERYINLELSITRNEMMRLEMMCGIVGVAFGLGACLSGLYGMNVVNGLEDNRYAFYVITLVFLIVLSIAIYITKLIKIKHRV
ncbi:hypothetical protein MACK_003795 [Theileria orientalis]|uniref:Magnesium transporter n=1 Tax=Theileria orientalis TaxID=68886 RepID=A0A976SJ19_THEOR|nr:hypothetical protein MACK_003795 [Theileria orientalis]